MARAFLKRMALEFAAFIMAVQAGRGAAQFNETPGEVVPASVALISQPVDVEVLQRPIVDSCR